MSPSGTQENRPAQDHTRPCRPGTVYLVGAGPGNPDLITVRGLQLIRCCDVLVYDNLMADEYVALSRAPEKIYVGKASGRHMVKQRDIGKILVDRARKGLSVVRLKGGDPFVFGRGGEECQQLSEAALPFVVVPGVTSGIAGPAFAGIPVTHRELSRGVTLLTGHFSRNQEVELPWEALAGLDHTLVFYMAVAALDRVCRRLMEASLDPSTPAALLEQATTGSQRVVSATLRQIARVARAEGVRPPALLVVGRVVDLGSKLAWHHPQALAGRTVIFTRAADRDYEAVERLRGMGAKVIDVPVVEARPRRDDRDVLRVMDGLERFDAVAFTSAAAAEFFFEALRQSGQDARALASHLVVAATPSVSLALQERGVSPDLDVAGVRERGMAASLDEALQAERRTVLVPRSSAAGSRLIEDLRARGMEVEPLVLYDAAPSDLRWLDVKMTGRRPDALVFLSGSGVDTVLEAIPGIRELDPPPIWACVGRQTASALECHGLSADVVPDVPDVDRLVDDLAAKILDPA